MNTIFWVGICLGALIGIPAAIVANLWTDPVRGFLSRRRTIRLNRKKEKELRRYSLVKSILEGDEAAKARLSLLQHMALYLVLIIIFNLLAFGGLALISFNAGELHQYWSILPIKLFVVADLLGSYAAVVLSFVLFFSSWLIMQRLQNFKQYEQSILEKWGSDAFATKADNDP
jgi:hypothetical protein